MASELPFKQMGVYTFDVYASQILGQNFDEMTLLAIMDADTAEAFAPITTRHPLIYPYLPTGFADDPGAYTYLKFRHKSGDIVILAYEWIQPATIRESSNANYIVRLVNLDPARIPVLREALAANGFNEFSISRE